MSREVFRRYLGVFVLTLAFQTLSLGILPRSEAKDLTEVLEQGFPSVIGANSISQGVTAFAPAFSQAVAQAVTQEFPLASVAPAFTYRYNPALSIFERSTGVPGPLFSERALTLGKGQLNLGVGYSYVDFSDLNGNDLDNITGPGLFNDPDFSRVLAKTLRPDGNTQFDFPLSAAQLRTSLDVNAHILVPSLRYGITEDWEVGLTIPIVDTFLRVRNEAVPLVDADPNFAKFREIKTPQGNVLASGIVLNPSLKNDLKKVPFQQTSRSASTVARAAGSSTGVGDITLRTKYQFWHTEAGGAALGLNLQLPSGEVRDFHGTDETHLSTFVYFSQVLWDRVEPHLNLGTDFNTDDVDRSSLVYSVGTTVLAWRNLGLMVDFLGRHEFDRLHVSVPKEGFYQGVVLDRAPNTCTAASPCFIDKFVSAPFLPITIKRNDIADFSFGLRYALGTQGSIFFGGIVPLNDDGFRAEFIPSGGVEYTF